MRGFNKVKKRIVSVLLAFVVMVGCIPFGTEEVKASVAGSSQLSKIEILDFSMYYSVRRHIVGGANRTLISAITSLRSCGIGTCRRLSSG